MRNIIDIVLGANIGLVTIALHAKYCRNRIGNEHRVCNQSKPPHSYTQPVRHNETQTTTSSTRQWQAAEDSHTQTVTDRRQLALLFTHSISYEYDSRHGCSFHLRKQNTSDTHGVHHSEYFLWTLSNDEVTVDPIKLLYDGSVLKNSPKHCPEVD